MQVMRQYSQLFAVAILVMLGLITLMGGGDSITLGALVAIVGALGLVAWSRWKQPSKRP